MLLPHSHCCTLHTSSGLITSIPTLTLSTAVALFAFDLMMIQTGVLITHKSHTLFLAPFLCTLSAASVTILVVTPANSTLVFLPLSSVLPSHPAPPLTPLSPSLFLNLLHCTWHATLQPQSLPCTLHTLTFSVTSSTHPFTPTLTLLGSAMEEGMDWSISTSTPATPLPAQHTQHTQHSFQAATPGSGRGSSSPFGAVTPLATRPGAHTPSSQPPSHPHIGLDRFEPQGSEGGIKQHSGQGRGAYSGVQQQGGRQVNKAVAAWAVMRGHGAGAHACFSGFDGAALNLKCTAC